MAAKVKTLCESCSRPEWHKPEPVAWPIAMLLIVVTFGAAMLLRPYRCSCCGSRRFGLSKDAMVRHRSC